MAGDPPDATGPLAQSLDEPLVVVDDGGRASSWNDAAAAAFGLGPGSAGDRADGDPATEGDPATGRLPDPIADAIRRALRSSRRASPEGSTGPCTDGSGPPAGGRTSGLEPPHGTTPEGSATGEADSRRPEGPRGGGPTDPDGPADPGPAGDREAADGPVATGDPGTADDPEGPVVVEAEHDGAVYECRVSTGDDRHTVVCGEVTDRVKRRAELERCETVLEHLPDPVYVTGPDGRFEFVNRAAWELSGYDRLDLSAEPVHASTALRREDVVDCRAAIRECLSGGGETGDWRTVRMVAFRADGERRPVENRQAVLVEDGEFAGTFGTIRDVSDRRRERERLQVLDRVLRHNVRTEASVVRGHAERIARTSDDPVVADSAGAIRDSVGTLLGIREKTREAQLALVGDGDRSPVELSTVVAQAVERVREAHPEATVETAVGDAPRVLAGPGLSTAVDELVENAVVHNDAPDPSVQITVEPDRLDVGTGSVAPRTPVVLRIADDGPGIPETERAVVAGDADVSPLIHSDGLGLWTAAWIVEEYGGKLDIEDRDDGGTVAVVHLVRAD